MRSIEDMLDELENANQGAGPDPHPTGEGAGLKAIAESSEFFKIVQNKMHYAAHGDATAEYDGYLKRLAEEPSRAELDYLEAVKAAQKKIEGQTKEPGSSTGSES